MSIYALAGPYNMPYLFVIVLFAFGGPRPRLTLSLLPLALLVLVADHLLTHRQQVVVQLTYNTRNNTQLIINRVLAWLSL